jgi:predicted acylesterase/phospholipase RssA
MVGACISGGGAKIGFAVGVMEKMREKGIQLDLATGISSGSICTAALCYGDLDTLKAMLLAIKSRKDVLNRQLFKVIWTLLTGLGQADGLYGMKIMRRKLDKLPLQTPRLRGIVGYVELKSGEIIYVSTQDEGMTKERFLDAVQASCSIPGSMQTQRVGTEVRVDGGVKDVLPLKRIIKDPLQVDEIHVICLSPLKDPLEPDAELKGVLQVSMRSIDILVKEALLNDLETAEYFNELISLAPQLGPTVQPRLVGKRKIKFYKYIPTVKICETTDFREENIQKGIEHGHKIAEEVLKSYPN